MPVITHVQPVAFALIGAYLSGDATQVVQVNDHIAADGRISAVLDATETLLDAVCGPIAPGQDDAQAEAIDAGVRARLAAMLPATWEPVVTQVLEDGFPEGDGPLDPVVKLAGVHVLAAYAAEFARCSTGGEFAGEAAAMLAGFHAGRPS